MYLCLWWFHSDGHLNSAVPLSHFPSSKEGRGLGEGGRKSDGGGKKKRLQAEIIFLKKKEGGKKK